MGMQYYDDNLGGFQYVSNSNPLPISLANGGGGATSNANYILQVADANLPNGQNLAALSTGIIKVTTATGVLSSITNSSGLASCLSDETGSGAAVFGTNPVLDGYILNAASQINSVTMSSTAMNVAVAEQTRQLSGDETWTFSNNAPTAGTITRVIVTGDGSNRVVTLPLGNVYSYALNATRPNINVTASTSQSLTFKKESSRWVIYGDSVSTTGSGNYLLSNGTANIASGKTVTISNTLTFSGTDSSSLNIGGGGTLSGGAYISNTGTFGITIDGGGSAVTTGNKGSIVIPYAGTISSATMLSDQNGNAVIDIWRTTFAGYPPTVSNTITANAKPTLSSNNHSQDTTLTAWNTTVVAGDIVSFNVDSANTLTRLTLALKISRTS